jgi:ribosomal-protein-serine acetyltransferase
MKFGNYSLSPPTPADAPAILELVSINRPRLIDNFPGTTVAVIDLVSTKGFVKEKIQQAKRKELFCFFLKDNKKRKVVGMFIIKSIEWKIPKAELGYYIDKDYEGKGITSKAVAKVIRHCFSDLKMNKLFLRTVKNNKGSQRVAEKNGFKREGTLRKDFRTGKGKLVDVYYYGLVKK